MGQGVSGPPHMDQRGQEFSFPADLGPVPGNLEGDNYTLYVNSLSEFLRRPPRRLILTDANTIAQSSIGHNITLQQLTRLLHLAEILPEEALAVFILLGGGNFFDLLLAFDKAYPLYYDSRTSSASLVETFICGILFLLVATFFNYGAVSL